MRYIDITTFQQSLRPLIEGINTLGKEHFPITRKAMRKAAYHIADYWIQSAQGHPIAGTDKTIRDPEYANSIEVFELGDFRFVIGSTNRDRHSAIVDGSDQRDMKEGLDRYPRRKYNKKGEPYLTVPFRHSEKELKKAKIRERKGGREKLVHTFAKELKHSTMHNDPTSGQRTFKWGGRLTGFHEDSKSIYKGMVRFDTSKGEKSSSAYMTFRTISVHSPADSWIIPAKPGIPITELVFQATKQDTISIIELGIAADFRRLGLVK